MATTTKAQNSDRADEIPPPRHDEAMRIAEVELQRFLDALEDLSPEDWSRPTPCALWNVQQMVSHVAGSAAAASQWSEFKRQGSGKVQRPYRERGMSRLDAQNQIQVDDRAGRTPDELVAELRRAGPKSINTRRRLPALVRAIRLPMGLAFPLGSTFVSIGYMMDVILQRDIWMHRLDLSRATGREMLLTPEHDGRVTALVVRDLARSLPRKLEGRAVRYELTGPAGGSWTIGRGQPEAVICMDALDFHLLASGRMTVEEARSRAEIEGDRQLAERALSNTSAPY